MRGKPVSAAEAERVVEQYRALVCKIALDISRTTKGQSLGTVDDLIQEGMIGLLHAARLFDPGRGVKFITYAYQCIRRWICQQCERHGGIIHVPADRKASDSKAAKLAKNIVTFPDFFDLVAEEHIDGPLQEEDEIANIRRLLRRLPPRHAMVLRARYLDGLTLRETAEILRVSKARVAQLERRALQIMRDLGYGDAQIDASTPDQKI